MLSFWEKESFIKYDIIIVGGGITGLSSSISIKEKNPKLSVAVFEAGLLPSGASTKNAGFACFGSLSELQNDEIALGTEKMLELVENRWKGLTLLRSRLGDKAIDFQQYGGYELILDSIHYRAEMSQMNQHLNPIFKKDVYSLAFDKVGTFRLNKQLVKQLIYNPHEGQIHTGKMMQALIKKVTSLGVSIFTNSKVDELTSEGVLVGGIEFKSSQTIVCTNAFTKTLIPDVKLVPGRGQVLITKPIKDLQLKGTFHYDEGFYYFRNIGNRVLLGGGRNQDFESEETTELALIQKIQDHLIEQLKTIILHDTPFEIESQWTGIMGFSSNKFPIVNRINNRTVIAVKLGGIGVALGSMVGLQAAELTLN